MVLATNREEKMKVKLTKKELKPILGFVRKYKNTKRRFLVINGGVKSFMLDFTDSISLYFWGDEIEISEFDDSSKLWFWQQIKRVK